MAAATLLALSHELSRTGAPLLLLDLLGTLKSAVGLDVVTWSRAGGPLTADFARLGTAHVAPDANAGIAQRIANRLLSSLGQPRSPLQRQGQALRRRLGPAPLLVYANTATVGDMLRAVARPHDLVVTHVHELDYWMQRVPEADRRFMLERSDAFVACSQATARYLQGRHEVSADRIFTLQGYVDVDTARSRLDRADRAAVRRTLGLPEDAFVVIGCGSIQWRKGFDLFIQAAAHLLADPAAATLPVHFVWAGGELGARQHGEALFDVNQAGLTGRVHFVGPMADPYPLYAAADLHLLTSREEPFGLVMLEAAVAQLPTVCFSGVGGPDEFVDAQTGVAVRYLDTAAMAQAVGRLALDRAELRRLGIAAQARALAHHDAPDARRRFTAHLNTLLRSAASRTPP